MFFLCNKAIIVRGTLPHKITKLLWAERLLRESHEAWCAPGIREQVSVFQRHQAPEISGDCKALN